MRIERYELTNFGSWRDVVYEPGAARLCVLMGENGLGKSTLLSEALGYALFRDFRGTVNGPVRLGSTDAAVTIEFTLNDVRYRAIRRRTTKGAGKSSSDLQIQGTDGTWTPVASGDKEVPAEVASLLHMDANTFRTSVSLAQSDLKRFVDASAGDRKEVLATIVVDPRFAPAAKEASRRALDLERKTETDRDRIERLGDVIAELEPVRGALARHRADVAAAEAAIVTARSARTAATDQLREVDAKLAAAVGVEAEQGRLTTERDDLVESWRRAQARRSGSSAAIAAAEATVAGADEIEAAAAGVGAARAEVDRLTAGEAEDRRLAGDITTAQRALEEIDRPIREAITTWRTKRGLEEARIRELEEHVRAGTSTCATCGQPIEAAAALDQLRAARERFTALGDEPRAPLALARASAALQRLESRRRDLAWDPAAMVSARESLTALERLAARADGLAAARATVAREQAAIVEVEAELERIRIRGEAVKARLAEISGQAAAAELRAQRAALAEAVAGADRSIEQGDSLRREADRRVARAEADVARLDQVSAERDGLAAGLAADDKLIERLRYLAGRFGLKGIPARVIEGVLPELTRYANDALGQLFGLQLDIRATRSSADGKKSIEALDLVVCKEGVGEVELERASGGQGTAIALALALGLSRLNARRAGTAIRSLVVDEPEGLDVVRLKALGAYLRDLVHRGELERIFVITHTTELAEFGDRVDEVLAGPDGVELRQVA